MEQLQIKRRINKQDCLLSLTEAELELAYRIKQRQYLDEDFANALAQITLRLQITVFMSVIWRNFLN